MPAKVDGVAFLYDERAGIDIKIEELLDHFERLDVDDDLRVGIGVRGLLQGGCMIGLHMVHDDVVKLAAVQGIFQIFSKYIGNGAINGINERGLFALQQVCVVGNTLGDGIYALKQGQTTVVCSEVGKIAGKLVYIVHL